MDDAIVVADQALETLPAPNPLKPDEEKTVGELMHEGLWEGLILGRDACRYARAHMRQVIDAGLMIAGEDLKVLRWGTDTAGWLTRAGVRIAEGEFRARHDDTLAKLLEQIAAAKGSVVIKK